MTLAVILGRFAIARFFFGDAAESAGAVIELTATLLLVGATFFVADGIQTVAAGALRGLNDTRLPLLFAAISYWLVGFPAAYGLGVPHQPRSYRRMDRDFLRHSDLRHPADFALPVADAPLDVSPRPRFEASSASTAYARRRLGPFRHAALQIFQILPHLLQRKSQREKPLGDVAGQAPREAFAAQGRDFGGIGLQRGLHRPDRGRADCRCAASRRSRADRRRWPR